ncbi:MAG: extracellular solute-binding protein [Chloroflexota bacterium]|nr:extracellular solute-binding protein [Chloroflexota bacterium]
MGKERPSQHLIRGRFAHILMCIPSLLFLLFWGGCAPKMAMAPTPEPVTLRIAYREHTRQLQPLFSAFHEQHPWITVEAREVQRFGNELDALLHTGQLDIFIEGRQALGYAQEGLLKPLDDIQLGEWAGIRNDYYKGAWEGLQIAGQQWGIPAGLDMMVVYINVDQAKALHVDLPGAEWDLSDFLELTTKMDYPQGLPYAAGSRLFGYCTAPESVDPVVFIYLHGGKIVDDLNAPSQVTLDDPRTIEAVQWYADLYNVYQVAPDPEVIRTTFRRGGVMEAAIRGACGVWLGWYSSRGGKDMPFEWSSEWKMLPLPRDRATFGLGDMEGYYITNECEHPTEALKLLRFLSDHQEASGQKLPPRKSLVNAKTYEQQVGEAVAEVARTFSENVLLLPAESSVALQKVGAELLATVERIIVEDLDAAPELQAKQDELHATFQAP